MSNDLPTGFRRISGKRAPPASDQRYEVIFRGGFRDQQHTYTAQQLVWIHDPDQPSAWDVFAVREAD